MPGDLLRFAEAAERREIGERIDHLGLVSGIPVVAMRGVQRDAGRVLRGKPLGGLGSVGWTWMDSGLSAARSLSRNGNDRPSAGHLAAQAGPRRCAEMSSSSISGVSPGTPETTLDGALGVGSRSTSRLPVRRRAHGPATRRSACGNPRGSCVGDFPIDTRRHVPLRNGALVVVGGDLRQDVGAADLFQGDQVLLGDRGAVRLGGGNSAAPCRRLPGSLLYPRS